MKNSGMVLALSFLALAGCGEAPQDREQNPQPTFHDVMAGEIDPIADEIWEIGNAAIGDQSEMVAARMTDQDWAQLADSATRLRDATRELGSLDPVVVVRPGEKIADEDVVGGDSAEDVQKHIDADTPGMRARAKALEDHMDKLIAAARARNAAQAGTLINDLDSVCEECHLDFWFPQQRQLVEQYRNAGLGGEGK